MSAPVVVHVGLSGWRRDTSGLPTPVPMSNGEIVADALTAWDAGAAVIHLQARASDGTLSARAEHFAPLIEGIRAGGCDAVLSLCCESLGGPVQDPDAYDCLRLRPELASFDLPAVCPTGRERTPIDYVREMSRAFRTVGAAPQIRCSNQSHVRLALRMREEGWLSDPMRFQFEVGAAGDSKSAIQEVLSLTSLMPPGAVWSVAGRGVEQLPLNVMCLIAGGHVHTGVQDNVWLIEGVPATNRELVERVVRIVDDLDRPLATPEEAREIMGLGHDAPRGLAWSRKRLQIAGGNAVDLKQASG